MIIVILAEIIIMVCIYIIFVYVYIYKGVIFGCLWSWKI